MKRYDKTWEELWCTHTHTHIYIYIYRGIKRANLNSLILVASGRRVGCCVFASITLGVNCAVHKIQLVCCVVPESQTSIVDLSGLKRKNLRRSAHKNALQPKASSTVQLDLWKGGAKPQQRRPKWALEAVNTGAGMPKPGAGPRHDPGVTPRADWPAEVEASASMGKQHQQKPDTPWITG